jgi:hypothetical protein
MNHLDISFSGLVLGFARYRNGRKWKGLWEAKKIRRKLMIKNVKQVMANCRGMLHFHQAETEVLSQAAKMPC